MPRLRAVAPHLVRLDASPAVVLVQARGYGLLLGAFGLHLVWGTFERLLVPRGRSRQVSFLGLHGLARAMVRLAPASKVQVPAAERAQVPSPSALVPVPTLTVPLQVPTLLVPDASEETA